MAMDAFPSPDQLRGAVQGTLLYLSLYFCVFIPFQSFSKFYLVQRKKKEARAKGGNERISLLAVKYYNSQDSIALLGDRSVGNFVEFAILFLPLLWMNALFVDPSESFTICLVYTASRAAYPAFFYYNRNYIWVSTFPGYIIYSYLMYQITFQFALAS